MLFLRFVGTNEEELREKQTPPAAEYRSISGR